MKKTLCLLASIGCAILLLPTLPSWAQPKIPSSSTDDTSRPASTSRTIDVLPDLSEVIDLVKGVSGYADCTIETAKSNGVKYVLCKYSSDETKGTVVLYPAICNEGKCRGLSFVSTWENRDVNWINAYNAKYSYGRAYLGQDGKRVLEMLVYFFGGVNPAFITESADVYRYAIKHMATFSFNAGEQSAPERRRAPRHRRRR